MLKCLFWFFGGVFIFTLARKPKQRDNMYARGLVKKTCIMIVRMII